MDELPRRRVIRGIGAATVAGTVAGCIGGDDDDDGGPDGFTIEPGTRIVFEGENNGWVGAEPSSIEGERNPRLLLEAGGDYEVNWRQGDGNRHNIEIRDGSGNVIDGLSTSITREPDEGEQTLSFEATEEMAYVVCAPHAGTMRTPLVVE